jgi:1-aminocyclopropane-1-carboxylate deaminase/D-cysteine desulfhydrase-like pyridoxal-dependent ACC family enzyme
MVLEQIIPVINILVFSHGRTKILVFLNAMISKHQEPTIQEISLVDIPNPERIQLFIKREDLIHPTISGNKWRKLNYNLKMARQTGHDTLLTFGGAYSNHLFAVAAAAREIGMKSIGIVRGEEHLPLNPTLRFVVNSGMQLKYISRDLYANKTDPEFVEQMKQQFGKFFLIPEGGTNPLAILGAAEIMGGISNDYDVVVLAAGTGGTTAGVIAGMNGVGYVIGVSVLKGGFLHGEIEKLLKQSGLGHLSSWKVNNEYHFGGYAKFNNELIHFINQFRKTYDIPLDPIYTGKMMFGVMDMIKKGCFPKGTKVLAIHTGGLQGIAGFNERFGNLIEIG